MSEIGRVAVVTGASAGVGRAVALRLAREGWRLGLIARDAAALRGLAETIRASGGEALPLPCDVADADAVFAAATEAERLFGGIDAWVNCAMVTIFAPLHDISAEEFRRVTEVTYLGYVHGTMAALRPMRRANAGVILQVGSALAYRSIPLQSAYCGAKHAITGFTESLRSELQHEQSRIRVTEVHLPAVNTPQFSWARTRLPFQPRPAGKPITPDTAARAVVAALHRPAREYWLGLPTMAAILGDMLAPGLADRYLARNAVEGQMGDEPLQAPREGNLFAPVRGLHSVDGRFEGTNGAPCISGGAARFGLGAAALAAACGLGVLLGRRMR
ncbi:SDR family oxidoreductase [Roseomonas sp. SSH11]|uniref:SDR family oxidoreductase n=1 Tax=Pararoseomonas baculiformis TaxID=2820812 RepID=A0ABS4ADJ5_9PROT|nr:SDR family oxidoreductase [Pararoseomonas baculiformis]MBP0445068.1 SDR family oxidoreductase [Pararoseomonas baculiformis]